MRRLTNAISKNVIITKMRIIFPFVHFIAEIYSFTLFLFMLSSISHSDNRRFAKKAEM